MVKVKYMGTPSPCRIKIYSTVINGWAKGEIKELSKNEATKLLKDNKNFHLVSGKIKEEKKPTKEIISAPTIEEDKEKLKFDFNNDGVEDEKDLSLAGKALANARKFKKQKEE